MTSVQKTGGTRMQVEAIKTEGLDPAGKKITDVYVKNPPFYAIYHTDQRVMVHYDDTTAEAKRQSELLAPLSPIRGEINGLIDGWRSSPKQNLKDKAKRYERRVADALGVA